MTSSFGNSTFCLYDVIPAYSIVILFLSKNLIQCNDVSEP